MKSLSKLTEKEDGKQLSVDVSQVEIVNSSKDMTAVDITARSLKGEDIYDPSAGLMQSLNITATSVLSRQNTSAQHVESNVLSTSTVWFPYDDTEVSWREDEAQFVADKPVIMTISQINSDVCIAGISSDHTNELYIPTKERIERIVNDKAQSAPKMALLADNEYTATIAGKDVSGVKLITKQASSQTHSSNYDLYVKTVINCQKSVEQITMDYVMTNNYLTNSDFLKVQQKTDDFVITQGQNFKIPTVTYVDDTVDAKIRQQDSLTWVDSKNDNVLQTTVRGFTDGMYHTLLSFDDEEGSDDIKRYVDEHLKRNLWKMFVQNGHLSNDPPIGTLALIAVKFHTSMGTKNYIERDVSSKYLNETDNNFTEKSCVKNGGLTTLYRAGFGTDRVSVNVFMDTISLSRNYDKHRMQVVTYMCDFNENNILNGTWCLIHALKEQEKYIKRKEVQYYLAIRIE